ncbi:antichymotrypsin-2-like [Pectinophora gossypiella]|uniref:antichymotrypsin-2-like n=1 Tax=Pectinophora gossypiella TaxID=13191 RepID=UPI00214EB795|nr:antichymotrypsin-2-like [Pectinophora gossypiella]
MKLLSLILLVSSWRIDVGAQLNRRNGASNINQDAIYFTDNRPMTENNTPKATKTSVEVQKSVEDPNVNRQTFDQDSYTQAALGVQNYPFSVAPLTPNANTASRVKGPSSSLQPPKYNGDNPTYYDAYSDSGDVPARQDSSPAQPPLPHVAKQPKITNVSLAISNFGINLLKNINRRGGNVVISPFSISELLALLQQGASGVTQQQISEALRMTPQLSMEAFRQYNNNFQKRGSSHNTLRVANNVYVADVFDLNPAFKRVATQSFGSEVTPTKFSKTQQAIQQINGWVAQKTNNKITDLLSEDAVGDNTQLVMVNAVYFKGIWAVKFKPESTLPRDFYVNEVSKKTIPFMRIRKIFQAGTDPTNNAQVIILPFENEQYSLMVVLPSPVSSLEALVSKLTDAQLASYHSFSPKEIDLEIPKFTAKSDTDLNPIFRKMGITNVFSQQSELSGLGTYRAYPPQLSSALHTAMLSIDEEGGSAAAATSFAVVALSYDDQAILYRFNRPFLAVLWDNESAVPLFMARIEDPRA